MSRCGSDWFPLKHLGVDVGGTSTRAHLLRTPMSPMRWNTAGGNLTLDPDRLLHTLRALLREANPDAAVIGVPGAKSSPRAAEWLARELAALPLPVTVMSDAELALEAAFGPTSDGIVVCAGTGSVAAVRKAGLSHQVGGHGYLIDDAGSAYDIGRRLLAATLRSRDQGSLDLVAQVEGMLGEPIDQFLGRAYTAPSERTQIAQLAQHLPRMTHPAIHEIVRDAAASLVALAEAARARFGALPIRLVGGVFRHPIIATTLRQKCGAALASREPHVAAAYMAAGAR
jgi:N-acetylglucosamine kinase-like BadF-type ATPase